MRLITLISIKFKYNLVYLACDENILPGYGAVSKLLFEGFTNFGFIPVGKGTVNVSVAGINGINDSLFHLTWFRLFQ